MDNGGAGTPKVGRLGSGSDYTAFLDHVGVPSFEAGFTNEASAGTYHSAYDDTYNLEHHLDPGYLGHAGSSRVNGVAAMRLADAESCRSATPTTRPRWRATCEDLQKVQAETRGRAVDLGALPRRRRRGARRPPRSRAWPTACSPRTIPTAARIGRVNRALVGQERALTQRRGVPGRPWFRHQVYAPGLLTGYQVQYLPGLRDAVEDGDTATAQSSLGLLLDSLAEATRLAQKGAVLWACHGRARGC